MSVIREVQQLAQHWRSEYYFWIHQTAIDKAMTGCLELIQQSRFKLAAVLHKNSVFQDSSVRLLENLDLCEKRLYKWSVTPHASNAERTTSFKKVVGELRSASYRAVEMKEIEEELLTQKTAVNPSQNLLTEAKQLTKLEATIAAEPLLPNKVAMIQRFVTDSKAMTIELKKYLSKRINSIDKTEPAWSDQDYQYIKNLVVTLGLPKVSQFMKKKRMTNSVLATEMIESAQVSKSIENIRNNIPEAVLKQAMVSFHKAGDQLEISMKLPDNFKPALLKDMDSCIKDAAKYNKSDNLQKIANSIALKNIPNDFAAIVKDCKKFNDAYDAIKYPNNNMQRVSLTVKEESAKRKNLLLLTKPLITQLEKKIHKLSTETDVKHHDQREKLEKLLLEVCIAIQNPDPEQGLGKLKELVKNGVSSYTVEKRPLQFFKGVSHTLNILKACEKAINQPDPLSSSLTQKTAKKFSI